METQILVDLLADGTEPRVSSDQEPYMNPKDVVNKSIKSSVHIVFRFQAIDHSLTWESVLYSGNLYVTLEEDYSPAEYSKESFIALLEAAEEQFQCKNVVVCLMDKSLIRPFVFLGFELLPPNHPLVPYGASKNMIFMSYQLEFNDL